VVGVPPPPPPPPGDGGGFTAPPLWERGRPIEIRDPTLTDVFDAAYNLYRLHWRALMGVVALLVVPVEFVAEFLTRNYRHSRVLGTVMAGPSQSGRVAVITGVIGILHLLIVNPLLTGAVARASVGFPLGEQPPAARVLDFGLSKLGPVALVVVLSLLAFAGGLILLVIPGLVFFIRFQFAPSVVMIEDIRGTEAMRRSWRIANGSSWRIAGILIVTGLFLGFISNLLTVPANIWAHSVGHSGWPIRASGRSLATVLTTPFSLLVTVLLYLGLRRRKEGLGLDRLEMELRDDGWGFPKLDA
jgi:hypothetical protein